MSSLRLISSSQILHSKVKQKTKNLDSELKCYITERGFVSFSAVRPCMEQCLYFNRVNGKCGVDIWQERYTLSLEKRVDLYREFEHFGIIGMLNLLGISSKHVIVIKRREMVAQIDRYNCIWKILEVEAVPVSKYSQLYSREANYEKRCLNAIYTMFSNHNVYYSDTADITNTFQRISNNEGMKSSLTEEDYYNNINDTYFWNNALVDALDIPTKYNFCVPCICGFVQTQLLDRLSLKIILIARVSRHRFGTFLRRNGVECDNGYTASQVELETVLVTPEYIASHVQIRGSIPLLWKVDCCTDRVCPPILVTDDATSQRSLAAYELHYSEMQASYGPIKIIDLLDPENTLLRIINVANERMGYCACSDSECHGKSDIHYIHIGKKAVHSQCSALLDRLPTSFLDRLFACFSNQPSITPEDVRVWVPLICIQGYFLARKSIDSDSHQQDQYGIFRTNDLECVDSTNTLQCYISISAIHNIVSDLKLANEKESRDIESMVKTLWIDAGDAISQLYTGTPSLSRLDIQPNFFTPLPASRTAILLSRLYMQYFYEGERQDDFQIFMCDFVSWSDTLLVKDNQLDVRLFVGGKSLEKSARGAIGRHLSFVQQVNLRDYYRHTALMRYFKFLRLYWSPKRVRGVVRFLASLGWLGFYIVTQRITRRLNESRGTLLNTSKSSTDLESLLVEFEPQSLVTRRLPSSMDIAGYSRAFC